MQLLRGHTGLPDELAKQRWMVPQRLWPAAHHDPISLVSVVRTIEREENIDRHILD